LVSDLCLGLVRTELKCGAVLNVDLPAWLNRAWHMACGRTEWPIYRMVAAMSEVVEINSAAEEFLEKHGTIQALPETAIRLIHLFRDPSCSASDLLKIVEQDAALSAKIMRAVNSSFYSLNTKITNLQRAMAYMGIRAVKEVTLASSMTQSVKPIAIGDYSTADLWEHSLAVAIFARELAARTKVGDPEDAFLAGMLHDVGLLFEAQLDPKKCELIFKGAASGDKSLTELEEKTFKFNHCQLGESISTRWKFPEDVRCATRWHHWPEQAPEEHQAICWQVFIADHACCMAGIGFPLTCGKDPLPDDIISVAGVTRESLDELATKLPILLRLHRG
jgi:HD-like signal output (HDOD) protein